MPELHKYTEDVLDEEGNIKIPKGDVEQVKDDKGNPVYITQERAEQLNNSDDSDTYEQKVTNLQAMWKNFCVSDTYEPGSVSKPITVAIGLDSGKIIRDAHLEALAYVAQHQIHVDDFFFAHPVFLIRRKPQGEITRRNTLCGKDIPSDAQKEEHRKDKQKGM